MFLQSLSWLVIGMLIGLIAAAARSGPIGWRSGGWWRLSGIGALTALVSGWLGVWLLGYYFALAWTLWTTVIGVLLLPRLLFWLRSRSSSLANERSAVDTR